MSQAVCEVVPLAVVVKQFTINRLFFDFSAAVLQASPLICLLPSSQSLMSEDGCMYVQMWCRQSNSLRENRELFGYDR